MIFDFPLWLIQVAILYMCTRLIVNITQVYLPIFALETLDLKKVLEVTLDLKKLLDVILDFEKVLDVTLDLQKVLDVTLDLKATYKNHSEHLIDSRVLFSCSTQ